MHSPFSFISTRRRRLVRTSGNSLIRLLLSRDGQGKNIGEKIERQPQLGCPRTELENKVARKKNKTGRGKKTKEGVGREIPTQGLAKNRHRSNISAPACRYC